MDSETKTLKLRIISARMQVGARPSSSVRCGSSIVRKACRSSRRITTPIRREFSFCLSLNASSLLVAFDWRNTTSAKSAIGKLTEPSIALVMSAPRLVLSFQNWVAALKIAVNRALDARKTRGPRKT